MPLRRNTRPVEPLAGARIAGCLPMTIQTAVLSNAQRNLGPRSLGAVATSSRPRTTPPRHRQAGFPVYAWKGETDAEYDWCIEQTLYFPTASR